MQTIKQLGQMTKQLIAASTTEKEKKPISPKKAAALVKATAASRAAMKGKSPRTEGVERTKAALLWVYRWGWTTTSLLEIGVRSAGHSGLAARMIKGGLLIKTPTISGGIDGTPSHFLTLSKLGLEHATSLSDIEIPYIVNPVRIKQATMNHHEIVQRLTAVKSQYWAGGETVEEFLTEKELRIGRSIKAKIPDAMWLIGYEDPRVDCGYDPLRASTKVAIEVELSPKWKRELDTFVLQSLLQLEAGTCDAIEVFANSPALLKRYELAFKPGTWLQTWTKAGGFWVKGSQMLIAERADGVIRFTRITQKMLGR